MPNNPELPKLHSSQQKAVGLVQAEHSTGQPPIEKTQNKREDIKHQGNLIDLNTEKEKSTINPNSQASSVKDEHSTGQSEKIEDPSVRQKK